MSGYDNHNPKSYYNYSDYNNNRQGDPAGASSSSSARGGGGGRQALPAGPPPKAFDTNVIHKPDEVTPTTPSGPPPPYSPPPPRSTSSSTDYGTVTVQPGLLDPSRTYVSPSSPPQQYQQQQQQPQHPLQRSEQPRRQSKWTNPHIPRDWQDGNNDDEEQQSHEPSYNQPRSRGRGASGESGASRMIRQALHSHNEDDSGDDADPGCCKKWCKCLFLAILIWLVILKYSDTIRFTPPSPDLSCHASVTWDDMPETINVEKDVWISVEGHVSSGSVIVHSMADSGQEGSIQTQIHVTPSLVEELSYELHDGRQTQLTIRLPQQGDHCVQVDMEIYLPDKAEQLRLSINNVPIKVMDPQSHMDLTDLRTTNAPIDLSNAWEGKRLTLQTANADIHMSSGDIEARDTVHLETANGAIHAANILSKHYIDLINANGVVQADLLQGDDRVHVETTNAEVRIDKVSSDKASIISSNGWIQVNHAVAQDSLVAKTSNAPIDIHVEQVKNGHTQLTTGNSPVTVHMTREYEGSITFTTSKDNAVNVHDAPENFDYDRNESYEKRGMRLSGNGELSVMTTNADADIFFDI